MRVNEIRELAEIDTYRDLLAMARSGFSEERMIEMVAIERECGLITEEMVVYISQVFYGSKRH